MFSFLWQCLIMPLRLYFAPKGLMNQIHRLAPDAKPDFTWADTKESWQEPEYRAPWLMFWAQMYASFFVWGLCFVVCAWVFQFQVDLIAGLLVIIVSVIAHFLVLRFTDMPVVFCVLMVYIFVIAMFVVEVLLLRYMYPIMQTIVLAIAVNSGFSLLSILRKDKFVHLTNWVYAAFILVVALGIISYSMLIFDIPPINILIPIFLIFGVSIIFYGIYLILESKKPQIYRHYIERYSTNILITNLVIMMLTLLAYIVAILIYTNNLPVYALITVTAILALGHFWIWPLQAVISAVSSLVLRWWPQSAKWLWYISPVNWDEFVMLPLPGLSSFLSRLKDINPVLADQALEQTINHLYQTPAARNSLVKVAYADSLRVQTTRSMAAFQGSLSWLPADALLRGGEYYHLHQLRQISLNVEAAIDSDSASNGLERLVNAQDLLKALRLEPGRFRDPLARWQQIIDKEIVNTEQRQRQEEPIPQVYVRDGRPLREDAKLFKGRRSLFMELEKTLGGSQRSTLLLFGQRRVGKTSALLQLSKRLGSNTIVIFLDMQKWANAQRDVELLIKLSEYIREKLPPSVTGVTFSALQLERDPYSYFSDWLERIEAKLGSQRLLLCIDEYETLEEGFISKRFDKRLLNVLRNVVQHSSKIDILFSGSNRIDELPRHWKHVLVNTETLAVSYLEREDAIELIRKPVPDFPQIYTNEAVERILELTHCQPYLIQAMCAQLVERMNKAKRLPPDSYVTLEDVEAVIPIVLEKTSVYFDEVMNVSSNLGEQDEVIEEASRANHVAQRILAKLALSPNYTLEREQLRLLSPDEDVLREAVLYLTHREFVSKQDSRYRLTVPLVARYIQDKREI